ncbi:MAG TPA: methyltransferase domain-containing protein [Terriglobales bacterium]|jgi:ubiquinone/menaquinone biosynthesis C-methylase UbiE|nr:methyltransferase domain-containing protein [Terriglobales bacterium]
MRRTVTAELLDSDSGSDREVRASLADLARINRWFGGISTSRLLIERAILRSDTNSQSGKKEVRLLEVGAGSGDVPLAIRRELRRKGVELHLTLLDRNASHLSPAQDVQRIAADACQLPFRDSSFDVVSCGLMVHHLWPEQVASFLNEALRVASLAVIVNDLRRSRAHLAAVYAGFPLYTSRLTRHDAPASVRAAYTRGELEAMLQNTSAAAVEINDHYLFRMGAIAWKKSPVI